MELVTSSLTSRTVTSPTVASSPQPRSASWTACRAVRTAPGTAGKVHSAQSPSVSITPITSQDQQAGNVLFKGTNQPIPDISGGLSLESTCGAYGCRAACAHRGGRTVSGARRPTEAPSGRPAQEWLRARLFRARLFRAHLFRAHLFRSRLFRSADGGWPRPRRAGPGPASRPRHSRPVRAISVRHGPGAGQAHRTPAAPSTPGAHIRAPAATRRGCAPAAPSPRRVPRGVHARAPARRSPRLQLPAGQPQRPASSGGALRRAASRRPWS